MTHEEKLAALQRWQVAIERSDALIDPVIALLGLAPESPIAEAVWSLQEALTAAVATQIDAGDWLCWYVYDNDMGRKGFEAGECGAMRPIRTLDDLLWVVGASA